MLQWTIIRTLLKWVARVSHGLLRSTVWPLRNTSTESAVAGAPNARCASIVTITIRAVLNVLRERRRSERFVWFFKWTCRRLQVWPNNPCQQKSKIQEYWWQAFVRCIAVAFCRLSCFWRYWTSRYTSAELKAIRRKSGKSSISRKRTAAPAPSMTSSAGAGSLDPIESAGAEFVAAILGTWKKQFKLNNTARVTIVMIAGKASFRRVTW